MRKINFIAFIMLLHISHSTWSFKMYDPTPYQRYRYSSLSKDCYFFLKCDSYSTCYQIFEPFKIAKCCRYNFTSFCCKYSKLLSWKKSQARLRRYSIVNQTTVSKEDRSETLNSNTSFRNSYNTPGSNQNSSFFNRQIGRDSQTTKSPITIIEDDDDF